MKDARIEVRLNDAVKQTWAARAKARGMTLAEFICAVVEVELELVMEPGPDASYSRMILNEEREAKLESGRPVAPLAEHSALAKALAEAHLPAAVA